MAKRKLQRYKVTLVRTIEHRAVIDGVEAANQDDAIEKAIEQADAPHANAWREGDTLGESSKAVIE